MFHGVFEWVVEVVGDLFMEGVVGRFTREGTPKRLGESRMDREAQNVRRLVVTLVALGFGAAILWYYFSPRVLEFYQQALGIGLK
ncbi:MAG: hypothetical protein ACFUZC_14040 [Chthoniobacteraceae bacterium]